MKLNLLIAAAFALLLSACNPMAQLDGAEQYIERFQQTYNSGDARALYGQTSEEFRDATTPEQMQELITLIDERMGAVESSERAGFNLDTNNGLTVSTVTMTTQFTKGEGTETYTFYGTGDDLRLVGWNVDSDNFLDVPEEAVTVVEQEPAE